MNLSSAISSLVVASGGEANLKLPDLSSVSFLGGAISGWALLATGLVVSAAGLVFGLTVSARLKALPVHRSMLEISELIYETAKTYLMTQFKFIGVLWGFIAVIIILYFGVLSEGFGPGKVAIILAFSLVGILGSSGVAWFGIRVNTYANSRTAFASLRGKPFATYAIPLQAGMSVGTMLISVELLIMLFILLFIPGGLAGACFIGFAIGESLGASALRIAGGIFTKIADIGSDLMKIVFKIKEDDARNPGVIADCTGDNAGDSVGPTADGFETYGVTGVALITFILLAVAPPDHPDPAAGLDLRHAHHDGDRLGGLLLGQRGPGEGQVRQGRQDGLRGPAHVLVWLTSIVSVVLTFLVSRLLIPSLNGDTTLWWKLSLIITCGTLAGAIIPEVIKVFTSTNSRHVREVVTASKEGGPSLNVLAGLTAGNFSAFWMGLVIAVLMGVAYKVSTTTGFDTIMAAPAVFAFGLVAFGFLGMGPVTIAVDSYGPVTDNAQSVYELSLIENIKGIKAEVKKDFGFEPNFEKGKEYLEENDGAGNTFKATAKPVLIGTAVVGATTMIFSIIVTIAQMSAGGHATAAAGVSVDQLNGLLHGVAGHFSILEPKFLLGLLLGGAVIYWFSGASTQAVSTGAYRAVEFIKRNIKLEGAEKASVEDSKKVVEICTLYAQKGMWNIFMVVFFATLSFAFLDEFFFIGYLISIAFFGLFQALFMANAGGAWDNAKKIVEVELKAKGTPLHDATVVGDTVGDPFKDTSSVAMNPVIKFTTLFGLLAVELALQMTAANQGTLRLVLSAAFLAVMLFFVYRSFYGMRIESAEK